MQAHNLYTSVYKAIDKRNEQTLCIYVSLIFAYIFHESERAVQYVIKQGAICRRIAMTCATKARCRLMIPICSPNLWPPMESVGGAVLCSFGVEKNGTKQKF